MVFGRLVLVFLPFFDSRVRDAKSQTFGKLRHRQREIDPLLAEVFP